MADMANAQITLVTFLAVAFVGALLALIVLLSLLRQVRDWQRQRSARGRQALPADVSMIPSPVPIVQPVQTRRLRPLAESNRPPAPARRDTAEVEAVVLAIEPVEGPTNDQRNVQKLIDFLKREATVTSKAS